jgi:hypothetical protein
MYIKAKLRKADFKDFSNGAKEKSERVQSFNMNFWVMNSKGSLTNYRYKGTEFSRDKLIQLRADIEKGLCYVLDQQIMEYPDDSSKL